MDDPTPFAPRPEPPYWAVIFASTRRDGDAGYAAAAARMAELATAQTGFLGIESARDAGGFGLTVSYWRSLDAIEAWRSHAEHAATRERGRADWYDGYELRVARVERAYGWRRGEASTAGDAPVR